MRSLLALSLLLLAPNAFAEEAPAKPEVKAPVKAEAAQVFGAGVHEEVPLVKISDVLAKPAEWIDKKIRVEGLVVGVCARRGCWVKLAGDKEFESLRVKVTDGQIVFPVALKGKRLMVEGVWTQIVRGGAHKACGGCGGHGKGEGHGPKTGACGGGDKAGAAPMCGEAPKPKEVFYQLRGLGAKTI